MERRATKPAERGGRAGEGIPFVVRWIHTQLAGRLGAPSDQRDYLYKLLNFCNLQLQNATSCSQGTSLPPPLPQKRPALPA